MGFFEEFLSQQVKKIEKTLSVDTDVEVIEGNSTELNNLLNKINWMKYYSEKTQLKIQKSIGKKLTFLMEKTLLYM